MLTDIQVRNAELREKPYKLFDSGGLYADIRPNGSKYWRLKYRFAGKEKLLAIGVYPDIGLKDARLQSQKAKQVLAQGTDPSEERKLQKITQRVNHDNTFGRVASEWFDTVSPQWSESHKERTEGLYKNHLLPWLGNRPIAEITPPELLNILKKAQERDLLETARRGKQIAGQIFRYAILTGRLNSDPSRDLAGALTVPKITHLAALTEPKDVRRLMIAIYAYQGSPAVAAALKLSALLFQRPGEMRQMLWEEIDWDACEWRYLVTKTNTQHIVPLARQSLEILRELHGYTSYSPYVFPSPRSASRPLSENAVRVALRIMGFTNEQMSAHGFRATARTLLDEVLGFAPELMEHQLAHAVRDPLGRAYNRTKHLQQRKEMMQRWADYLDELRALPVSA